MVESSETFEPLGRRRERAQARRREILVVLGREDREYSSAYEFKDIALVLLDRRHDRVKIIVQQFDDRIARQSVGQTGEVAHIGHHDDRTHALALGPQDLPGEDAPRGLGPQIGVEQTGADPSLRACLGNRGQGRVDVFELSDVDVPEPIRPVGRPGHRRKPPEGAVQRQREIVGAAGLSDSVQQRIFTTGAWVVSHTVSRSALASQSATTARVSIGTEEPRS